MLPVDVKLFDDMDEVERDAGGNLDRAAQKSLFSRLSWFRMIAAHCPPPGRLLVARAQTEEFSDGRDNGRSRAWLFLMVEDGHARVLASWYALDAGFVAYWTDQASTPDCIEAMARTLRTKAGLKSIEIYPLPAGMTDTSDDLRRAGWLVSLAPANICWSVQTQYDDFEAYWAKRPSKLRNTAARKAKAAKLDIVIHRRFDEAGWADYEAVYRASWKPDEGSMAFLRSLAEQEGAAGTLRLGIASKDGQPIAAQFWLVENGNATIHKLAYVEAAKDISPGTVLSVAMFRSVVDEDKVQWINYGLGDEPYKGDWMEHRTLVYRMTAFNPATLSGLAGYARASAAALVGRRRSR